MYGDDNNTNDDVYYGLISYVHLLFNTVIVAIVTTKILKRPFTKVTPMPCLKLPLTTKAPSTAQFSPIALPFPVDATNVCVHPNANDDAVHDNPDDEGVNDERVNKDDTVDEEDIH
ncbi:hypothetical protein NDU88_001631 [Pleurodeles waltl]|uniref:Transmembrane protein n=1 Tax=Pleurodeles waltl TaxID=8319 RepID=A0AAV7RDK7_PLEWA|nr:hypothetical protein NDU88_001631 [Pleurodeles waltl]